MADDPGAAHHARPGPNSSDRNDDLADEKPPPDSGLTASEVGQDVAPEPCEPQTVTDADPASPVLDPATPEIGTPSPTHVSGGDTDLVATGDAANDHIDRADPAPAVDEHTDTVDESAQRRGDTVTPSVWVTSGPVCLGDTDSATTHPACGHRFGLPERPKALGAALILLRDYDWPQLPFRSPLRGPWLTSVFGAVLLVSLPIVIITGLLSWVAYGPRFGQSAPGDVGWLHLPVFDWPTRPPWLYRLTQGVHVGLGLILIPWVLAKLWSVIPKFFQLPPVRTPAQAIERISLLALVGGILFEIVTGVLNIQYDYIFGFSFYTAHYWGAWVFIAGFVVHVAVKMPTMIRSLRSRSLRSMLRTGRADTVAEPRDETGLVAQHPGPVTISRRGALGLVAGGSLFVTVLTAGETAGGPLRRAAFLLPRGRSYGMGPNDFQINRTALAAGLTPDQYRSGWRLHLNGGVHPVALSRPRLLAMEQHTVDLPIACVEGWSTVQTWTGVRLRDLAAAAGVAQLASARVKSLERVGAFRSVQFTAAQMLHPDSLLALRVNGVDLSLDHGFPARIMMPAIPGVHATKWVQSIDFRER
jgi:DMSO/TMAO reductase YedYZ molybdopterin-dependent catalytic subunit